jgi:hypothetical protein
MLLDALNRHRGKGMQKITVELAVAFGVECMRCMSRHQPAQDARQPGLLFAWHAVRAVIMG